MTDITWVIAANVAVWIGLGAYLALLGSRQKELEHRLRALEAEHD